MDNMRRNIGLVALALLPAASVLAGAGYRKLTKADNPVVYSSTQLEMSYRGFELTPLAESELADLTIRLLGDRYIEARQVGPRLDADQLDWEEMRWDMAKPVLLKPPGSQRSYLYFDTPIGADSVMINVLENPTEVFGLGGPGTYCIKLDERPSAAGIGLQFTRAKAKGGKTQGNNSDLPGFGGDETKE